ncbi:hypothetical protein PVAP13_5NG208881 [Panicum virgatum]|uniref:Uncharacterized protein n=1 Tax=Panicum virgatum TaxID=38727 RepID=A0A8T0RUY2_PANVG|nr:hypothetical protein PVAP13_5NG208881 [Panicum virgatum]
MAGGHKGLGADGLHGLGVDASQQGLGTAGGQHGPGDMAGTGATSASGGSRRGNKKSRDDEKIDEETNRNRLELGQGNYQHGCRVVEKTKNNRPLQNEDEMNVMFGSIINEEIDHWNPMSSNPIIPLVEMPPPPPPAHIGLDDNDEENDMGANIDSDNGDEVLEISPTPGNAKRKAIAP